jgi:hypothetical protein
VKVKIGGQTAGARASQLKSSSGHRGALAHEVHEVFDPEGLGNEINSVYQRDGWPERIDVVAAHKKKIHGRLVFLKSGGKTLARNLWDYPVQKNSLDLVPVFGPKLQSNFSRLRLENGKSGFGENRANQVKHRYLVIHNEQNWGAFIHNKPKPSFQPFQTQAWVDR